MRSLSRKQVGVARPLGVRVAPLPLLRRDGPAEWTPGPQPGGRGSTPRRGTPLPGSRAARRPAVTRKAGVRSPPWQPPPGGRGSRRAAADRDTGVRVPRTGERVGASVASGARGARDQPAGRPSMSIRQVHGSKTCGRRSAARISARHAEDAGSSPAGHTAGHTNTSNTKTNQQAHTRRRG
jgi:hypothetical protein